MSRNITANHMSFSTEAVQERILSEGKLLFTKYRSRNCAILLKGSQALAMQTLDECFSQNPDSGRIGSIYVGKVKNVVKNIHACFVEIAGGRVCFLSEREVKYACICDSGSSRITPCTITSDKNDSKLISGPDRTDQIHKTARRELHQGDELLVQIEREAHQTKEASLTAHISITNEFAVLSIGSEKNCYSKKLSAKEKERIRNWLTEEGLLDQEYFRFDRIWQELGYDLPCPSYIGLVIRTRAGSCSREMLIQSLRNLAGQFAELLHTSCHRTCFSCVREAAPPFTTILDKLAYSHEYGEIVTDDRELYAKLKPYCEKYLADKHIRLYEDSMLSLSGLYSLESRLEEAFSTRIWLNSGAYLILQVTEAMTVIDVNSGKYEGRKGYFYVNCEAAREIARQLRLRNLSGIIIVDFISMNNKEQENELLELLRDLVRNDRLKTTIVDMTPLGLVEITRKREGRSLREQFLK